MFPSTLGALNSIGFSVRFVRHFFYSMCDSHTHRPPIPHRTNRWRFCFLCFSIGHKSIEIRRVQFATPVYLWRTVFTSFCWPLVVFIHLILSALFVSALFFSPFLSFFLGFVCAPRFNRCCSQRQTHSTSIRLDHIKHGTTGIAYGSLPHHRIYQFRQRFCRLFTK